MDGFGITHRAAQRIVGPIETDGLRQLGPIIGSRLHDGATGNRGIHPRRQGSGAQQCRDDAAEKDNAQQLSCGDAHLHT